MIDYHCHILPGIDDGPATMDEAVEMAAALKEAGFTSIYCTPHLIKGSFDVGNDAVRAVLAELQKKLHAENIKLRLIPGREYYLDEYLFDYLKKPMPLGETKYIMLEISKHITPKFVKEACFRIKRRGYIPMIAHPERCGLFSVSNGWEAALSQGINSLFKARGLKQKEPQLLDYLKSIGCAFQANLGSFAGWYGARVEKKAHALKEKKIYTHFGTDFHSRARIKILVEELKNYLP